MQATFTITTSNHGTKPFSKNKKPSFLMRRRKKTTLYQHASEMHPNWIPNGVVNSHYRKLVLCIMQCTEIKLKKSLWLLYILDAFPNTVVDPEERKLSLPINNVVLHLTECDKGKKKLEEIILLIINRNCKNALLTKNYN